MSKKKGEKPDPRQGSISPERLKELRSPEFQASIKPKTWEEIEKSGKKGPVKKAAATTPPKQPKKTLDPSQEAPIAGVISVTISKGKELSQLTGSGDVQCYVKVKILVAAEMQSPELKAQTQATADKAISNPLWQEDLHYTVTDMARESLVFVLKEKDLYYADTVLGRAQVSLSSAVESDKPNSRTAWVNLNHGGQLLVTLSWKPSVAGVKLQAPMAEKIITEAQRETIQFLEDLRGPNSANMQMNISAQTIQPATSQAQLKVSNGTSNASSNNSSNNSSGNSSSNSPVSARHNYDNTTISRSSLEAYAAHLAANDPQKMSGENKKVKSLQQMVSLNKKRYHNEKYDLDLAYITDRVIAMGFPSEGVEGLYRNPMSQCQSFLNTYHPNSYKVYNLCCERSYSAKKFFRCTVFPFEDHCPPTIGMIHDCCRDIDDFLTADKNNVVIIHCKAGKGRTGTMICCYFVWRYHQKVNAIQSLDFYGNRRTFDQQGVTIPSQRRFVKYWEVAGEQLRNGTWNPSAPIEITAIVLTAPPANFGPTLSILADAVKVDYKQVNGNDILPKSKFPQITIKMTKNVEVDQEVRIDFWDEFNKKSPKSFFRFWFHTKFLKGNTFSLKLSQLDKVRGKERFPKEFRVTVIFATKSEQKVSQEQIRRISRTLIDRRESYLKWQRQLEMIQQDSTLTGVAEENEDEEEHEEDTSESEDEKVIPEEPENEDMDDNDIGNNTDTTTTTTTTTTGSPGAETDSDQIGQVSEKSQPSLQRPGRGLYNNNNTPKPAQTTATTTTTTTTANTTNTTTTATTNTTTTTTTTPPVVTTGPISPRNNFKLPGKSTSPQPTSPRATPPTPIPAPTTATTTTTTPTSTPSTPPTTMTSTMTNPMTNTMTNTMTSTMTSGTRNSGWKVGDVNVTTPTSGLFNRASSLRTGIGHTTTPSTPPTTQITTTTTTIITTGVVSGSKHVVVGNTDELDSFETYNESEDGVQPEDESEKKALRNLLFSLGENFEYN